MRGAISRNQSQSGAIRRNHHEGAVALRQCMAGRRWEDRHELLEGCERRSECELAAGKLMEPVGKRGRRGEHLHAQRAAGVLSGEGMGHRA